jgi:hypothetical protein
VGNVTGVGHTVSSNKQLIIGTAAVLLLLVGFISGPKVISAFRAKAAGNAPAKQTAEPILPPLLKEADLIGSVWNVTVQGFTLKVSLNANGQAVAGSDSMIVRQLAKAKYGVESLPGKWRIEGPKLMVSTSFEGKEFTTALTISGTNLVSKEGVPIVRVK